MFPEIGPRTPHNPVFVASVPDTSDTANKQTERATKFIQTLFGSVGCPPGLFCKTKHQENVPSLQTHKLIRLKQTKRLQDFCSDQ